MSSSTTKRTSSEYGIMGDETVNSVAAGNCIAARVALLGMVAVIRGIFWCVIWLKGSTKSDRVQNACSKNTI